jgi:hypothetical protein
MLADCMVLVPLVPLPIEDMSEPPPHDASAAIIAAQAAYLSIESFIETPPLQIP